MQYVLVSSCLLGSPVRYNGAHKRPESEILDRWVREGRVVGVCPEVAGGLGVPRRPAEIEGGVGGARVIAATARVVDDEGHDVSAAFVSGAEHALRQARLRAIRIAVLKEGSPSCGSGYVYDGSFTGARVANPGVTAAMLQGAGIRVFSELQLAEADAMLRELEGESR
jgi:uncharacterized protein YbbK (DUF523 family)